MQKKSTIAALIDRKCNKKLRNIYKKKKKQKREEELHTKMKLILNL